MKVVITNTVTLNGGDAAILQAVCHLVKCVDPHAEIEVFDSQAAVAQRYYPDTRYQTQLYNMLPSRRRQLHQRRLLLAIRLLRSGLPWLARLLTSQQEACALQTYLDADVVISTGGTYLVEHYDLRHRIFEFQLVAACGKDVVFFTQSLGPFKKPTSIRGLKPAFARSPLILLRDERSRRHLLELGVDEAKLTVLPDAVFALADEQQLQAAETRAWPTDRPPSVGISVRAWKHFAGMSADEGMAQFEQAVADLAAHLVRAHAAKVVFVSTCQGISEYWTHDSETAARIVDRLPEELRGAVTVNTDFHTPAELSALLGKLDVVVATRMHAAILALNAGTPVLPIAYEFKTEELFAALGMAAWVTRIEDVRGEPFIARFEDWLQALPTLRRPMFEGVGRLRRDARTAADLLRRVCA